MEAILSTETYLISDNDGTGLIPEGVESVVVDYKDGKPGIFYGAKFKREPGKPLSNLSEASEASNRLNSQRPTTQEGVEEVIGLLKKLSK